MGSYLLAGKAPDRGLDAAGRDSHPRGGNADLTDQQAHCVHEGVVVEEGLAHAHEDKVDAVGLAPAFATADGDSVAGEHGGDLPGDLARGQVAPNAELRGKAELTVDRAADLTRDANCSALVVATQLQRVIFRQVAIGHPDRLHRLAVLQPHQITLRAVDGARRLRELWQGNLVARLLQRFAHGDRQSGHLGDGPDPLLVECIRQLRDPVGRLSELLHDRAQLRSGGPEQRLGSSGCVHFASLRRAPAGEPV